VRSTMVGTTAVLEMTKPKAEAGRGRPTVKEKSSNPPDRTA